MTKLNTSWLALFAALIALPLLGGLTDHTCKVATGPFCLVWQNLQWESLVAGTFGLMGGIFVIISSRDQIKAMRETTAQTIKQAKLHRADEACAPLILAHQVTDRFRFWAASKLEFLIEIKMRVDSGSFDKKDVAYTIIQIQNDLGRRCRHVEAILDTHTTTTFTYEVSSALRNLSKVAARIEKPTGHRAPYMDVKNGIKAAIDAIELTENFARTARGMIESQIDEIRDRCDI